MRKFLSVGSSQEGSMSDGAAAYDTNNGRDDDIDGEQPEDVFIGARATGIGSSQQVDKPNQAMLGLTHLKKL